VVEVLSAGLQTSIQDLGRVGWRAAGVPVSGAMDRVSAIFANKLLNNSPRVAIIEFAWPAPVFQFHKAATIAVVGADCCPRVNDVEYPSRSVLSLKARDILSFKPAKIGFWGYLAIKSGWQSEVSLGSRSQYVGVTPRSKLASGDTLAIATQSELATAPYSSVKMNVSHFSTAKLCVDQGPEWDRLPQRAKDLLIGRPLEISSQSNRMAYLIKSRLNYGAPEIITSPVQPGTVQLTPSGNCIVLMRDAQTTGGYARVLQLPEISISQLSQKKLGSPVEFILK